jgi:hypothetical protein
MKPYIPTHLLPPAEVEARRLRARLQYRLKRGIPLDSDDSPKPPSPSTARVRAWRHKQRDLRSARLASFVSPKPSPVPETVTPVPSPSHHRDPVELGPAFHKLGVLTAAVLQQHPYTQTPEFLLALTELELRITHPETEPEPLMPSVLTFD